MRILCVFLLLILTFIVGAVSAVHCSVVSRYAGGAGVVYGLASPPPVVCACPCNCGCADGEKCKCCK